MQVFVPFKEPIEVAQCLDAKRLNKQIVECAQIVNAILCKGKGWFNHPIVHMYKEHLEWLKCYFECLLSYQRKEFWRANVYNNMAIDRTPIFLTDDFCDQHKRRLYTKNPQHYKMFEKYGFSEENWYFVNGELVKYVKGKRV